MSLTPRAPTTPRPPYPLGRNRTDSSNATTDPIFHPYETHDRNQRTNWRPRTSHRILYQQSQLQSSQQQDFSQSFVGRSPQREEEPIFAHSNPIALGRKLLRLRETRIVDAQEEMASAVESVGKMDMASVVEQMQCVQDQRVAELLVGLAAHNAHLTSKLSKLEITCERYRNAASLNAPSKEQPNLTYDYRNIKGRMWKVTGFFGRTGTIDLHRYIMEMVSESCFIRQKNTFEFIQQVTRYVIARIIPESQRRRYIIRSGRAVDGTKEDFPPKVLEAISGMNAQACNVQQDDGNREYFEVDGATRRSARATLEDLRRADIHMPANAMRRNRQEAELLQVHSKIRR